MVRKGASNAFASLWAALALMHTAAAAAGETHNVLVLYSNDRLLPANVEGDRGLREVLAGAGAGDIEIFEEFLDKPRFGGPSFQQTMTIYLHDKYAAKPPEVMVVGGQEALAFVLHNRARLFPRAPVVHMGVSRSFVQAIDNKPVDLIGVPVQTEYLGTIEQALLWHPLARKLVLVTGTSPVDRAWEARLREETSQLARRVTLEFFAGLPTGELVRRLGALGPDAVVFTPGYYEDEAGRIFAPRDSAALIAQVSAAPVYGPFNTFMGTGVVGGRMPTNEAMGRQAGAIVTALIAGSDPAAIRLPAVTPTDLHVDWRQVKRWGIDQAKIPKDTIVHFRDPSLWEAYRKEVIAAGAAIFLLAALSVLLMIERRSLRSTTAALKASDERMTLAARAAKLAIWHWTVSDDRISPGPARPLFESAGHAPVNLKYALAAAHPADRDEVARTVQQAVAANHELDLEYRVMGEDGQARWLAVRGRPDSGNSRQWLGVVFDINERKVAQIQAEEDRTALRHMARVSMLGQMSASIAHQLNQPLTAILANAEAARQMLNREPVDLTEIKEICDDIVTQDQRAANVIRRLSALFKRREMQIERVDLHALVAETVELLHADLVNDRIALSTQLTAQLHCIDGDKIQLQQVLLNLILNAADAMRRIPIVMRQLLLCSESSATEIRLRVTDRGPGIAPENLDKVFEPFWSAKPTGMGIGLSICQAIVVAHHGILTAANNPGEGATFTVKFPAHLHA